jgi:hypothetical protein
MNKHAENIDLYAQDWKKTDKPWTLWQYRQEDETGWRDLADHSLWGKNCEYRRKPKTIRVGDFDVPEPERETIPYKATYFYFNPIASPSGVGTTFWIGSKADLGILQAGLLHLTFANAEIHANALISLSAIHLETVFRQLRRAL